MKEDLKERAIFVALVALVLAWMTSQNYVPYATAFAWLLVGVAALILAVRYVRATD
ncbi:MAG: hypothetical protein Q4G21_05975 [Dermabacter sp.]|nr:hypothetical protein [Dermabacter sp.]